MDKAVQELLDLHAIKQVMIRYADRIDANDPEGAAACFAEDGIGNYWGIYKGRSEIAARLTELIKDYAVTSHHLSNENIQLAGDKATSMAYVYAFHRMIDSGEPMHYWGRWIDSFVRVDGEWFIAEREVIGIDLIFPGVKKRDSVKPRHPGYIER
ncbi:MAG: nuclear transport factor 2 family protein [Desulfobacterales bacterium]|jgi:ketosteroid isomerase-like protein|nr:nuclear transport factor 2 family protein [Desulfobacteraceae bacterium]MBT7085606.1 nuclear transport factor 2 family protein [Desulfobacterales bacterium]MBT7696494.1 nuclear transport factor 2 family protein [Desulfobacterales bacterium]